MANEHDAETSAEKKKIKKKELENYMKFFVNSSDDEAPDEVTFKESKAKALHSMKLAKELAEREKEILKEKRRKRMEFFQEQKKKQLFIADKKKDSSSLSHQENLQSEAVEEQQVKEEKKKKLPRVRKLKGNYKVMIQEEKMEDASYRQQEAEDFIQERLYGAGSCRTTNNELLSLQVKKGVVKGAAVTFLKKGWACKDKTKAERIKKRWIHKQISC